MAWVPLDRQRSVGTTGKDGEGVSSPVVHLTAGLGHREKPQRYLAGFDHLLGGFAWFYLGLHSETRHGGGPPRDSVVLSVHGKVAATVRGLHSLKLPNLWLLETNTQPSSWDGLGTGQHAASALLAGGTQPCWLSQGQNLSW